jgi:hypothetical protein
MRIVTHDDIAKELPTRPRDRVLQTLHQSSSVGVIVDDLLARITPGHDMVDRALEFDAKSSRYYENLPNSPPVCPEVTKNLV